MEKQINFYRDMEKQIRSLKNKEAPFLNKRYLLLITISFWQLQNIKYER